MLTSQQNSQALCDALQLEGLPLQDHEGTAGARGHHEGGLTLPGGAVCERGTHRQTDTGTEGSTARHTRAPASPAAKVQGSHIRCGYK